MISQYDTVVYSNSLAVALDGHDEARIVQQFWYWIDILFAFRQESFKLWLTQAHSSIALAKTNKKNAGIPLPATH